jgi:hypothetical protein
MRLVELKIASVDVSVAWMRKAMRKSAAATNASICVLLLMDGEPHVIPVAAPLSAGFPGRRRSVVRLPRRNRQRRSDTGSRVEADAEDPGAVSRLDAVLSATRLCGPIIGSSRPERSGRNVDQVATSMRWVPMTLSSCSVR